MESKPPGVNEEVLYKAVLEQLAKTYTDHIEIEILPSGIQVQEGEFALKDGKNCGIPKKVLIRAFLYAKTIFMSQMKDSTSDDALDATMVILLFDPEFLTAANFRKRYILALKTDHDRFMKQAERELSFLSAILASPLHRQSKSPTLWYHRYWLLKLVDEHLVSRGETPWSQCGTDDEMFSIYISAEHHPNNYYAWQHGRRMISLYSKLENNGQDAELFTAPPEIVENVLRWCLKHPSDTAGWSFLLFVMNQTNQERLTLFETLLQVMSFAEQTRWEKVALWHFIRTLYVSPACVVTGFKDNILYGIPHFRRTGGVVPLNGKALEPGKAKDDWDLFISR